MSVTFMSILSLIDRRRAYAELRRPCLQGPWAR